MSRKVIISGASGLLGRSVLKEFQREPGDWEVLGLAYKRVTGALKQVDLTNRQEVNQVISDFKPNVIVHCAAERKPDVVEKEPETTKQINVSATQYICEAAAAIGAWVLYISTDYVFDGTKPPYKVNDEPNPLNKYGLSKLEGEKVTLQVNSGNGVLRLPILYAEVNDLGESAVTCLFEKVKDTANMCKMSDYERRFPTHCDDIAVVIRQLSQRKIEDPSLEGIFHWSGDENMTKYDMAIVMAEVFNLPTQHIEADKSPSSGAARPYNSALDCSRIEQLGLGQRSKFKDAIKPILEPFYRT